MRIIGEFDIDNIKITVFKMNERISVKFETNLLEQTYKFRDGSAINNMEDVQKFCSPAMIKKLNECFADMAAIRSASLMSMFEAEEEMFDEII
ncbi:MAG: hypothetical protein IPO92_12170 [Saprospiraceae bacterium]|nr:hypothetical protein [Saprospiraceae bacterium]